MGSLPEAERIAKVLIRRDPGFRDGQALLATLRYAQGDTGGAASAVSELCAGPSGGMWCSRYSTVDAVLGRCANPSNSMPMLALLFNGKRSRAPDAAMPRLLPRWRPRWQQSDATRVRSSRAPQVVAKGRERLHEHAGRKVRADRAEERAVAWPSHAAGVCTAVPSLSCLGCRRTSTIRVKFSLNQIFVGHQYYYYTEDFPSKLR